MRSIVAVMTAALLGGGAIGPNCQRPEVAEPPTLRGQTTAEAAVAVK